MVESQPVEVEVVDHPFAVAEQVEGEGVERQFAGVVVEVVPGSQQLEVGHGLQEEGEEEAGGLVGVAVVAVEVAGVVDFAAGFVVVGIVDFAEVECTHCVELQCSAELFWPVEEEVEVLLLPLVEEEAVVHHQCVEVLVEEEEEERFLLKEEQEEHYRGMEEVVEQLHGHQTQEEHYGHHRFDHTLAQVETGVVNLATAGYWEQHQHQELD